MKSLKHRPARLRWPAQLFILWACLAVAPAHAACTNPAGNEGDVFYNSGSHTYQFCNGFSWLAYSQGGNCVATGGYSPVAPSGHGYFVLSNGTFNGNLGYQAGADADCLSDLTTHTGWIGYSTANSNGQLVADKVHAFLCEENFGDCMGNLMPLTTYYFANAGSGGAGGASMTTDSNGFGPNDSANWSGSTYFNGTYTYWTGRNYISATQWHYISQGGNVCSDWTDNSSGDAGQTGTSAATDNNRWNNGSPTCDQTYHLICYVNP